MGSTYVRLKPDEPFYWPRPDSSDFSVRAPETLAMRALRSAGLLSAFFTFPTPGCHVEDYVLAVPTSVREIREDEVVRLQDVRRAALRAMDRIERFAATDDFNDDDNVIEARDAESGARLLVLRGRAPARIEPHVAFEFPLRSGEVILLDHQMVSVPRQMWAVIEVEAIADGLGGFFFVYNLILAFLDNGLIRVGDYHPSLSKSLCFDAVCQYLLTALDVSGEPLEEDIGAAMSFLSDAHRQGLAPGVMPAIWVDNTENYPKRRFAERLNAAMTNVGRPAGGCGTNIEEPTRRLIKTFADAELYASEYMRYLGFSDAVPTPVGADGGIDVVSSSAVAQVKMEGVSTGRPVVQAIAGIASLEGKKALVFSLAGYTSQALEWADRAGVACLEFGVDGSVEAVNSAALELAG